MIDIELVRPLYEALHEPTQANVLTDEAWQQVMANDPEVRMLAEHLGHIYRLGYDDGYEAGLDSGYAEGYAEFGPEDEPGGDGQ